MSEYVLITGVTGFLGKELAASLISMGKKVLGVGRKAFHTLPESLKNSPDFSYIQKNLLDFSVEDLEGKQISDVYHLASLVEYAGKETKSFDDHYQNSIKVTSVLLDVFKQIKAKNFIFSSTFGVMKFDSVFTEESCINPNSNYNLSKYICEKLIEFESRQTQDSKFIVLRFPAIFGKNHHEGLVHTLKEELMKNKPIELYAKGELKRCLLYYKDAVKSMILVSEKSCFFKNNYELFLVATSDSVKVSEIAMYLKEKLKSESKIILSDKKNINSASTYASIDKLQNMVGFCPLSVLKGLDEYLGEIL